MSDLRHLILFLVGFGLLLGGFVVGIGALEYEVVSLGEVDGPLEGARFVSHESNSLSPNDETIVLVQYDALSQRDREIVDRVLAGERVVFRQRGDLPGKYGTKGEFGVQRDGEIYLIDRHVFFNWRTSFGLASLTMGLVGVAAVSEAIRRRHFPHRSVFWTHR